MKTFQITKSARIAATGVLLASLAACGGGGGGGGASTGNTTLESLGGGSANTTTGTVLSGAYNLTSNTGAVSSQTAAVSGTGASTALSFGALGFSVSGVQTDNPSWSAFGGRVKADGKVLAYCTAGQGGTSNAVKEGTRVLIAADAVAVTNASELKGLSFTAFNCADNSTVYTFGPDGSLTISGSAGNTTLDKLAVDQYLTEAGYQAFFSTSKFRVYKVTVSGATRYAIASLLVLAGTPSSAQVALLTQN